MSTRSSRSASAAAAPPAAPRVPPVVAATKVAPKKRVAKVAVVDVIEDDAAENDDDDVVEIVAPAPTKATPKKRAAKVVVAAAVSDDDIDGDDDVVEIVAAAPAKIVKPKVVKSSSTTSKDATVNDAPVAKRKPKVAVAAVVDAVVSSDDDAESEPSEPSSDSDNDDDDDGKKKKKKSTKAKAAPRARAPKASAPVPSSSAIPATASSTPPPVLHTQLCALFSTAQHSFHAHSSLSLRALALLSSSSARQFQTSFESLAYYVCSAANAGRKDAGNQRVVEWMGATVALAFAPSSSSGPSGPVFAEKFMSSLLDWTLMRDRFVRGGSLLLFAELMKNLPEDAELPDWFFERSVSTLALRAGDKSEDVRVAAARAMHRFQGAAEEEEEDVIGATYRYMMSYDASPLVRRAALEHVSCPTSSSRGKQHQQHPTLLCILARLRDVAPAVREAAYAALQSQVHLSSLSIAQRVRVLRLGLRDRAPSVKVQAQKLVTEGWLTSRSGNVIKLLEKMDVEAYTDECVLLVTYLLSKPAKKVVAKSGDDGAAVVSPTAQPPYTIAELTPEKALYWRVMVEHHKSIVDSHAKSAKSSREDSSSAASAAAEALEAILPDTIELCAMLREFHRQSQIPASAGSGIFISAQILALLAHGGLDLTSGDEMGRRNLDQSVGSMLRDTRGTVQALVAPLMKVFRMIHTSSSSDSGSLGKDLGHESHEFTRIVLELLNDVQHPLDAEESVESLRERKDTEQQFEMLQKEMEKLNIAKQACINVLNIKGAELIKEKMVVISSSLLSLEHALNSAGKQDDPLTWVRLLLILSDLLEHVPLLAFDGRHQNLVGTLQLFIMPGLQHAHQLVQSLALKALGLYSLLHKPTAAKSMPMFVYAAGAAETQAQKATAMRAVTDLMMMFEDILDDVSANDKLGDDDDEKRASPSSPASPSSAPSSATSLFDLQTLFNTHLQTVFALHTSRDSSAASVESTEVCVMAVECLAKLLLYARLPATPSLLSALLFIYFHPHTDTRATQCLAVFLPAFLIANPELNVSVYMQSIVPTLRILAGATANALADDESTGENVDAVWRDFSLDNALQIMFAFLDHIPGSTRPVGSGTSGHAIHRALALELLAQIGACAGSDDAKLGAALVKGVASLPLGKDDSVEPIVPNDEPSPSPSSAQVNSPFLITFYLVLQSLSSSTRHKVIVRDLTKFTAKFVKAYTRTCAIADDMDDELAKAWLDARHTRVDAIIGENAQREQDDLDDDDDVDANDAPRVAAASARKNRRQLRPKTPAKDKRKAAQACSDDDDKDNNDVDSDGPSFIKRPGKGAAAPSSAARPSRASKVNATLKIAKDAKRDADQDKIIDAESASESEDEEKEDEEEDEDEDEEA